MASEIIFPEKLDDLSKEDLVARVNTLEDYIRYMVERIDFAFSAYPTRAGFKNGTESVVLDTVDANMIKTLGLEVGDEIQMGPNAKISWGNVTNQPSIPSDSHITQITKDTVTTQYVNAMNLVASDIKADTTISNKLTCSNFKMTGGQINIDANSEEDSRITLNSHKQIISHRWDYKTDLMPNGVKVRNARDDLANVFETFYTAAGPNIYVNGASVSRLTNGGVQMYRADGTLSMSLTDYGLYFYGTDGMTIVKSYTR